MLKSLLGVLAGVVVLAAASLFFFNTDTGRDWLAGHASLYAGQSIRIDGPVAIRLTPPGLSVSAVSVSGPDDGAAAAPWLSVETISATLTGIDWTNVRETPLQLTAGGGIIHAKRFRQARGRRTGGGVSVPLPPFALAARFEDFRVAALAENLPDLRVDRAVLTVDPQSGGQARAEAAFGEKSLSADIEITLGERSGRAVPAQLAGQVDFAGLRVTAQGALDDVVKLRGLDIALTAGGDIARSAAGVATAFTDQQVTGRLSGDWGALTFDMDQLKADTEHGSIDLAGRIRQERERVVVERGHVVAEAADLARFLGDFGIESTLNMAARFNAEFAGDYDGAEVNAVELTLGDEAISVTGSGTVRRRADGGMRLDDGMLMLRAADAAQLVIALGAESSPVSGRLAGSASVNGSVEKLVLEEVMLGLGDDAITASGNGTLVAGEAGVRLTLAVNAKAADSAAVVPELPMPEWFGARGAASAVLAFREGRFSLSGLDATFQGDRGEATIRGDIDNLAEGVAPQLTVTLEAAAGQDGGLQSLALNASLPGGLDAPGSVSLEGRLGRGRVQFDGEVAAPRERRDISGDFRFEADADAIKGSGPGADGAAVLEGQINIGDLDARTFEMTAAMTGTGGTLSYSGDLDDSFAGSGTLKVESMNLNVLTALAGVETHFPNLARFQARITHEPGSVAVQDVKFFTGASQISGELRVVMPDQEGAPIRASMRAISPELYLADLGVEGNGEQSNQYFSKAPLSLDAIVGLDLDVTLNVNRLHTQALDYRDVEFTGQSRGGVLEVSSRQQLLGGGSSVLTMNVDAGGEKPDVRFNLELDAIDPGELRVINEGENKYSGDIDANLDIHGQGDSVSEILGSANGYFLVRINHAVLPNRKLNLLSADFLFETLRTVNPFMRESDELQIECGIMGFVVRDGVARADKTVVIRGKRLLIVSEGEIDLGTEEVAMVIRPKAQEGIGLNTAGLVKFIGIGGTLAEPQIRTDPKGLLMTGASIGAAVASGGMSLFLQNIFDRLTTGKGECQRVEAAFRDQLANSPVAGQAVPSGEPD